MEDLIQNIYNISALIDGLRFTLQDKMRAGKMHDVAEICKTINSHLVYLEEMKAALRILKGETDDPLSDKDEIDRINGRIAGVLMGGGGANIRPPQHSAPPPLPPHWHETIVTDK
ncbi:hypothetical protein [Chitinophaga nivalis]|uniref:Uncharacterized protein n=1 Tax=Chitinophaga nivalis TaxID=2991709 RepID=A0ABT3ISX4_9BACT|nr:hypothetical protein [Chitinophaga nivalis]MCW3463506.1 hypothetical protein [Chitinophaga nivalis]MCW3486804.1 hypothetical protein [Chitinophaga nivalis]